jgi:hypothetical protein
VSHSLQNGTALDRLAVVYSSWYDTPVVMRVANARTRKVETELHCTITGESEAAVHIHIGQRERNICKTMILAVEELPESRLRQ